LQNDKRAGTVGFALTILQRRLASSPNAIFHSLRRRRERLQKQLRELELLRRGGAAIALLPSSTILDAEDLEDLDEAPENEVEEAEEKVLDQATAASTIQELQAEIQILERLEKLAAKVAKSGVDTKWRELANLLSTIFTPAGLANRVAESSSPYGSGDIPAPKPSPNQKLVIFTEHRDTLSYLHTQIATLIGRPEAIVMMHGGMGRACSSISNMQFRMRVCFAPASDEQFPNRCFMSRSMRKGMLDIFSMLLTSIIGRSMRTNLLPKFFYSAPSAHGSRATSSGKPLLTQFRK
jgi:hypothetical protein